MPGTKTAEQLKAILKEQRDAALAVQQVTAEKRVQDEALETEKASSRVFIKDTKNKENKEDPMEVYRRWLAKHKKTHQCKEDNNSFNDEGNGRYRLNFKDVDAEEDFLRELAKEGDGEVRCWDVPIAYLKNGELIDPRTNQAFPKGEYAALRRQIDQELKSKISDKFDQVMTGAFQSPDALVREIMSRPVKTASLTASPDSCLVAPTPSNEETKGVTANTTEADQNDENEAHIRPSGYKTKPSPF